MSEDEKHFRRLNYCGTCKTIGSLYGQKARLLLNHDTVFLAEILSSLSGENVADWQKSYQSFNCLNLPKSKMPFSLQFAATTNVILTEFKLADHISDEKKHRYKFAQNAFSKEFRTAENLLKEWKFPFDEVKTILQTQDSRENNLTNLDDLTFPTAQTTAFFFREGVKKIGRDELENLAFEFGFAFGKLIYLLDAFEDYEKDFSGQKFNAIRAAFDLNDAKLTNDKKRKITTILREIESEIARKIYELPIAESQKMLFIARLSNNLQNKLKTNLPTLKTKKVCAPKSKTSFKQRWQTASEKARSLAYKYRWQMPLVFLFIFVFALVAPARVGEAKSARECFDLSFNLMFIGAIFGSVLAFPKTLLMQNLPSENIAEEAEKKRRWCDYCDCGCDCCDCDGCGCCDNCDCSCD